MNPLLNTEPVALDAESLSQTASRRTVLITGAAAAIGAGAAGRGLLSVAAQEATVEAEGAATEAASCVLAAEMTEGPYFLDGDLIRKDITEGIPGVPLTLRIGVSDATACIPLANAAVDIWHCDAQGYYSGISGENPGGGGAATTEENLTTTFLRGIQLTGDDGIAEFQTIYPGWYVSRTVHIHMKVLVDGTAGETYEDGTVTHTGQLFFEDEVSNEVFSTHEAYSGRDEADRTVNDGDNILGDHEDEPGYLVTITGSVEEGFIGTITIGVDPEATPASVGVGGGGRPPGGGEGGPGGPPPDND